MRTAANTRETRFRNSFTSREGHVDTRVITGRIINVNLNNWTVDVRSQFDRLFFFNIQIANPYCHYNRGEGIYAFPDIGATCTVTMPSDSSPPYVSSFIMPHELVDSSTPDAPQGTTSHGAPQQFPSDASFAGGRPVPKPGDIYIKGRDSNFVILHRGGVLQIGSTELSQRIFIPLNNFMMDVSENYAHHNAAGSIVWGIQEGPSQQIPSQWMQTYRVFANDQFADIRITAGKIRSPLPEPSNSDSEDTNLAKLNIGTDPKNAPIIYEVVVAPTGFSTQSGQPADNSTRDQTSLRFFFDRKGGTFLRCMASMLVSVKQQLFIHVKDQFTLQGETNVAINAKSGIDISGGKYTHIKGDIIRLGGGSVPVARQGDIAQFVIPTAQFTGTVGGSPATGVITFLSPIYGTIVSGNSKVLA